ncbi:MAG: diguanylate cyclase [Bacilli bacterium]|nr:diguanylate cyclase [Bacilli bacterium]
MRDAPTIIFFTITMIVAVVDVAFGINSFRKRKKTGYVMGITCILAACATFSYLLSISNDVDLHNKYALITSTFYFSFLDFTLLWLLHSVLSNAGYTNKKSMLYIFVPLFAFAVVDTCVLFISALQPAGHNFAVSVTSNGPFTSVPQYVMGVWFYLHLGFTYTLVALTVTFSIMKAVRVPYGYKKQYNIPIVAVLIIVLMNALFLFIPKTWGAVAFLDFSIPLYSIGVCAFYWAFFNYAEKTMPAEFKTEIFENIRQGILLYDYKGEIILSNTRAKTLLGEIPQFSDEFFHRVSFENKDDLDEISIQRFVETDGRSIPLRIDYKKLQDEFSRPKGFLFAFEDSLSVLDPITNFAKLATLHQDENNGLFKKRLPRYVTIFDINGLGAINQLKGQQEGNKMISSLSDVIRRNFPPSNYFVRGHEAHLIVICRRMSLDECQRRCQKICEEYEGDIEFAIQPYNSDQDLTWNITEAYNAMETKKLLNPDSAKSSLVTSMIKMLQETDPDTERHVKRTTKLARELGKKLGLNDSNQARLELLTILHDIGKVGIPIEILNKPDKLTPEEFAIIKLHTEKGYQIAMSSKSLESIALEIKYHHERWDGHGYPDGITKESIPYLSRIVSVVDSFDAMTNDRIYRKAMSKPAAVRELIKNSGTQFDPKVVSAFIELLDVEVEVEEEQLPVSDVSLEDMTVKQEKVFPVTYSHYLLDENNRIVSIDDNFVKFSGYTNEDIKNNCISQSDLIPSDDQFEYLTTLEIQQSKNKEYVFFEHRLKKKDGSLIPVYCLGKVSYDPVTLKKRSDIFITDVANSHYVEELRAKANHEVEVNKTKWENKFRRDALTHLLSRGSFESDLEQALLKKKYKILLMIMDLRHFKEYNEKFGHREGDALLKSIASFIKGSLRDHDLSVRLGGDEFGVALLFEPAELDEVIIQRAEDFMTDLNSKVRKIDKSFGQSQFRAGISITRKDFVNYTKIYEDAYAALYNSKDEDFDSYCIAKGKSFDD